MSSQALQRIALIVLVAVIGMFAGSGLTRHVIRSAQAAANEQSFAAVQAVNGALAMLKSDLERAGFVETGSTDTAVAVRIPQGESLNLIKAGTEELILSSPDGQRTISYRFGGGMLVRAISGAEAGSSTLLQKVSRAGFQAGKDGETLNVSFAVALSGGEFQRFAHFRRAS